MYCGSFIPRFGREFRLWPAKAKATDEFFVKYAIRVIRMSGGYPQSVISLLLVCHVLGSIVVRGRVRHGIQLRDMRRVYLDNNATTPVLPQVLEAMQPYFGEHFGNASSIHHHGQETRAAVERARESVADLLGCRPAEVVFTSGGTEADNLAIFGLVRAGDHVITSTVEHHAVLNSCKHFKEKGIDVTFLPVDGRGLVDP